MNEPEYYYTCHHQAGSVMLNGKIYCAVCFQSGLDYCPEPDLDYVKVKVGKCHGREPHLFKSPEELSCIKCNFKVICADNQAYENKNE